MLPEALTHDLLHSKPVGVRIDARPGRKIEPESLLERIATRSRQAGHAAVADGL